MTWNPKYLLIDFDGTLFDTQQDIASSINHVRESKNLPRFSREKIAGFVGEGAHKLIRRSFADYTSVHEELEGLYGEFHEYYMQNPVVETRYYPGVKETLERYERKIVLSNKPEVMVRAILRCFDDQDLFLHSFGGDSFNFKKPESGLMDELISATGLSDLRNAAMIGDGQPDHDFAKNIGIPFVCCNYGFSNVVDDYENMVRIDSFAEIPNHLTPSR